MLYFSAGHFTFEVRHVGASEEELSVQVAHLDAVVVRAPHAALGPDAQQGELLQLFAAQGARADQEQLEALQFLEERESKEFDEVLVAGGLRDCAVCVGRLAHGLLEVTVEPLLDWGLLSCLLHDFLRCYPSHQGRNGCEFISAVFDVILD